MIKTTFRQAAIWLAGILFLLAGRSPAADNPPETDWFKEAKLGAFMHFLPHNAEQFALVDKFDVPALATQLEAMGAKYFVFTVYQNAGYLNAPNAAYDRYAGYAPGEKCATRDLPLELYRALNPKGIRLILYVTGQTPNNDPRAQKAFGLEGKAGDRSINLEFAKKWATVIQEWSDRYQDKVAGWWFDGCYQWIHFNEDIATVYAEAARHGNPQALVTFNPGVKVIRHTRAENYTAGELDKPLTEMPAARWLNGVQWHALTSLGSWWGKRDTRYSTRQWIDWVRAVTGKGGVVTLDMGPNWDPRAGPVGALSEAQAQQFKEIRAALNPCPYPRSTVITGCTIEPAVISFPEKVGRPGDNWPVTWAADGKLYTFAADGVGFTPQAQEYSRLPCVVQGTPADGTLSGRNIPTDAIGKGTGGDVKGRKASGLIAIPDPANAAAEMLVAWIRNMTPAGGAALMYSRDHGATWTWAWGDPDANPGAIIPELGYPSWLQAGKGNAAAPDNYLYFYSQAGPTSYKLADQVILGRVPKTAVLDRTRYEYFSGTPELPAWSPDIRDGKPALTAIGECYRPSGIYNPALKRYFLLTANGGGMLDGHPGTHTLGIYESAHPWGPWRTVCRDEHFQPQWGVFAPQIVPAWISDDGKTGWLLYSCWPKGPYKFNLQRLVLATAEPQPLEQ
jgi:hypothetical protein